MFDCFSEDKSCVYLAVPQTIASNNEVVVESVLCTWVGVTRKCERLAFAAN